MYRIFEHTADIGIEVESTDLERAFEEAAIAMVSLSVNIENVERKIKKKVEISSTDYDSLLVKFLSEILYLLDAENFVPKLAKVKIENFNLSADLEGENYSREKHGSLLAIKAVTYHMINVDPSGRLRVIFDI